VGQVIGNLKSCRDWFHGGERIEGRSVYEGGNLIFLRTASAGTEFLPEPSKKRGEGAVQKRSSESFFGHVVASFKLSGRVRKGPPHSKLLFLSGGKGGSKKLRGGFSIKESASNKEFQGGGARPKYT